MLSRVNDNISFSANIVASVKNLDKARLKNIKSCFTEATKMYPNEVLYLKSNKRSCKLTISDNIIDAYSENNKHNLSTITLNSGIGNMSDTELVKQLVKGFKILRLSETFKNLKNSIQVNTEKYKNNKIMASKWRRGGKEDFAVKYDKIADLANYKLNKLNMQLKDLLEKYNYQREEFSKNFLK